MVTTVVASISTGSLALTFFPEPGRAAIVGLALLAIGQLVVLGTLWRGSLGWRPALLVLVLTAVGLLLAISDMVTLPELSDTWWPRTLLIATPGYLIVAHRRGWILATALLGLNAVLHVHRWYPNPNLPEMTLFQEIATETGQYIAYAGIALVGVAVTRGAGRAADAAIREGRQAREDEAAGRVERTQTHEADRFVHDEVLHTLRTMAMDRSVISTEVALSSATGLRKLLEMQQEAAPTHGFVEELQISTRTPGLTVRVVGASGLSLPRDVAATLTSAVSECLRNVARHSGTDEAEVIVRRSGFAVSIMVKDSGRGFTPGARATGLGLRESVLARMEDIGGSARIVSAPGRGTTVHLRWSPIPRDDYAPSTLGGGAMADLFPSLAYLLVPTFVQGLWAAALLATLTRSPVLALLGSVLCVLVGAWSIRRGLRCGLTGWESLALGLFTWACTALSVLLLPNHAPHPRLLWLVATVTAISSVLSLFRPLWEAVVFGLGTVVITTILLRLTQPLSPITPNLPIILAPVITVGIAVAVRTMIDRCTFEIWSHEESLHDQRAGVTGDEFFRSRLDRRLLGRRSALVDLLDEVITDPSRLESADVRERADLLERSLRDVLALSADQGLAEVLSQLRLGGWDLRSRWSADPPPGVLRHIADALLLVPATVARSDSRRPTPTTTTPTPTLTLTASEVDSRWRVSLVALPESGWMHAFQPGPPWHVERVGGLRATFVMDNEGVSEATV